MVLIHRRFKKHVGERGEKKVRRCDSHPVRPVSLLEEDGKGQQMDEQAEREGRCLAGERPSAVIASQDMAEMMQNRKGEATTRSASAFVRPTAALSIALSIMPPRAAAAARHPVRHAS